jgi:predicted glycosyltransferase
VRSVLFCNEVLGLGHLRRQMALAAALSGLDDQSTALVVTGCGGYGPLRAAPRVDVLKLPAVPVSVDSRWWSQTALVQPAQLSIPPAQLLTLRAELSMHAVRVLDPDVVVVDCAPFGRGGDLQPMLEQVRARGRSTVALGLRDFPDGDDEVSLEWTEDVVSSVRRLYDLVLVYNACEIDDPRMQVLRAAGLPIHRTGLVGAAVDPSESTELGAGYLLVSGGGGIDAFALLNAVIDAVSANPIPVPVLIVTGPMMHAAEVALLRQRAAGIGARVERQRADMESVLAGARAVVSMAGYSSVAEILASGKPALLVPRAFPREEQLYRAQHWAAAGLVEMLDPGQLEPIRLGRAISGLLEREPVSGQPLTGADEAARILQATLSLSPMDDPMFPAAVRPQYT